MSDCRRPDRSDCEYPDHPHHDHPCGRLPEAPGDPCRFCGEPVPDPPPCPACWKPVTIADVRGIFADAPGLETSVRLAP